MNMKTISSVAAAVAVAALTTQATAACCDCRCKQKGCMKMDNKEFYIGGTFDANGINQGGKFDTPKAKEAYFDLMRSFNYPVYPSFLNDALTKPKDGSQYLGFWATDFVKGDFMKFGMGGVIWVDEVKEEYFGHDIYLLPLQSIAEHLHVAGTVDKSVNTDRWTGEVFKDKKIPAKMESWLVRHGWVYSFSEVGEDNLDQPAFAEAKANLSALLTKIDPATGKTILKCRHVEKWEADGVAHKLPKACTWHFMMGGTKGAIISEFANFHDSTCNRFSVPGVGF